MLYKLSEEERILYTNYYNLTSSNIEDIKYRKN